MSYHARLTEVIDAYIANSKRTQEAQEEFNAASELLNKAEQNLNEAISAEDIAFSALMQLRQDVLDGGYEEGAPAVEPEPVEEAPVIESVKEVPAPEVVTEAPAVIEEAAPAAESFPVEEPVAEPVVEIVPEPVVEDASAVVVEEAPEVAKGDDHFINDEF